MAGEDRCSTDGCKDEVTHKSLRLCAACNSWRYVWATGRKSVQQVQKRMYQIHRLSNRTNEIDDWRKYSKRA